MPCWLGWTASKSAQLETPSKTLSIKPKIMSHRKESSAAMYSGRRRIGITLILLPFCPVFFNPQKLNRARNSTRQSTPGKANSSTLPQVNKLSLRSCLYTSQSEFDSAGRNNSLMRLLQSSIILVHNTKLRAFRVVYWVAVRYSVSKNARMNVEKSSGSATNFARWLWHARPRTAKSH